MIGEKGARGVFRHDLAAKEQAAAVGILRAELHIVAHDAYGRALRAERAQKRAEFFFERAVHALRRLVEQQHARLHEQHLRQRGALLLAAGEVKGMPVKQRRASAICRTTVSTSAASLPSDARSARTVSAAKSVRGSCGTAAMPSRRAGARAASSRRDTRCRGTAAAVRRARRAPSSCRCRCCR